MDSDMDRVEQAILTFALRWLPYRYVPAEDVFVEFGLTTDAFLSRLGELVDRYRPHIHPTTAQMLESMIAT